MDYMNAGGISGLVAIGIVVIKSLYEGVNHKRVRSKCCGKTSEVSLDIENTTPQSSEKPVEKPLEVKVG